MFENLEEVKAGQKEKTEIVEVKEGTQGDFRSEKYLEKVEGTEEEVANFRSAKAVQISTTNGAVLVIGMPKDGKVFPNSNLALFKATYGEYPREGMQVTTKVDDNGFKNIVLEK